MSRPDMPTDPVVSASGRGARNLRAVIAMLLVALAVLVLILLRLTSPEPRPAAAPATAPPESVTSFANRDGSPLRNPLGLAAVGDRIYVAESDAGVVRVFSAAGRDLYTIRLPKRADDVTAYPSAIADLGDDRLAVVDTAGGRVLIVSIAREDYGEVVGSIGSDFPDTAPVKPTAIAVKDGNVIVADSATHALYEYDAGGSRVATLAADLEPSLTFVGGMAVRRDALYVADSNAGRVVTVSVRRQRASVIPARFTLPRGLAVAPEGLVVADPFARHVAIISPDGRTVRSLEPTSASRWSPTGVAFMASGGRYFVSDPATGRVYVFAAER